MNPIGPGIGPRSGDPGPDLFALPVQEAVLVFSPLQDISALLNQRAYELLGQALSGITPPSDLPEDLADLAVSLMETPGVPPAAPHGRVNPPYLGIIPTRACNLACKYCDFDAELSNHPILPIGLAEAAVEWFAKFLRDAGRSEMEIHFFGGEPLAAPEVVKAVLHRTRILADRFGLRPRFEVSTNGVMDQEIARFVGDHFDSVVLSLDGFRTVQDRHRPFPSGQGTFDAVCRTARILRDASAELCLRCCVSEKNVRQLAEIAEFFCDEFSPAVVDFETLAPNSKSRAAGLSPPNPYRFARHGYHAMQRVRGRGIGAVYAATEWDRPRHTFCPLGRDTLILSPDGRFHGCYLPSNAWRERGLELGMGRIHEDGKVVIDTTAVRRLRSLVMKKDRCVNCFCRWTCAGGCHVHHTPPGSAAAYSDFCIQTRLLTACRLLDDLGQQAASENLLDDPDAMAALARRPTDRFFPGECNRSIPKDIQHSTGDPIQAHLDGGHNLSLETSLNGRHPEGNGGLPSVSDDRTDPMALGRDSIPPTPRTHTWAIPYIDQPIDFWQEIAGLSGNMISEVYAPLPDSPVPTGRPLQTEVFLKDLLRNSPFPVSLLINPIVLPNSVEPTARTVIQLLRCLRDKYGVSRVTVADALLAMRIRERLPDFSITASVLMDVARPHQAAQLNGVCDTLVPASRIMRNHPALREIRRAFSGRIRLLVNEGCIPDCLFRTQHFYEMGRFTGHPPSLCRDFLQENPWRRLTGAWVLPQHLHFYEDVADELKLAGRVTLLNPQEYREVLTAYLTRSPRTPDRIGGGPASMHLPVDIEADFYRRTLHCDKLCHTCTVCRDYFEAVTQNFEDRIPSAGPVAES